MSNDNELIAENKWSGPKANIYVRCSAVGCKYLNGPFHNADDAIIAATMHENCWMDKAQERRHKTYFQDLQRTVTKNSARDIEICPHCGRECCDCQMFDNEGNEI